LIPASWLRCIFAVIPCIKQHLLTITPLVIKRAKTIFLLATGAIKGRVLARALQEQENISALPIQLLLNATWILDHDAVGQLSKSSGGIHP
jgi:6-phosphogluconolactonase/glucosamine-6-phosphate isomerase/deaminase